MRLSQASSRFKSRTAHQWWLWCCGSISPRLWLFFPLFNSNFYSFCVPLNLMSYYVHNLSNYDFVQCDCFPADSDFPTFADSRKHSCVTRAGKHQTALDSHTLSSNVISQPKHYRSISLNCIANTAWVEPRRILLEGLVTRSESFSINRVRYCWCSFSSSMHLKALKYLQQRV
jgi:hypothetical protein